MDEFESLKWKVNEFISSFDAEHVVDYFATLEIENAFLRKTLNECGVHTSNSRKTIHEEVEELNV